MARARRLPWVALVLTAYACSGSSTTTVTAPSASRCGVTLTAQPAAVDHPGGRVIVAIGTNRECVWQARSEAEWLTLDSAREGQGEGSVTIAVSENPSISERRGTVVVNDVRVGVAQAATPCAFRLDQTGRSVDAVGGRHDIRVTAPSGCAWSAASGASWIAVLAGASGSGPGSVSASVAPNEHPERRTGTLTIAGHVYTVSQNAAPAPPPPSPNPPAPTPPSPPSDPTPPAPPSDPAPPGPPTPPPAPPTPPPAPPTPSACTFAVSPRELSIDQSGGNEHVRVETERSCAWTAESQAVWMTVTGNSSGTGNAQVRVAISPNPGIGARTGVLLVAGRTVTVTQDGLAGEDVEMEGQVGGLTGTCPSVQFTIGTLLIVTNADTRFHRIECSELHNGTSVRVRGRVSASGVLATRIDGRNDDDDDENEDDIRYLAFADAMVQASSTFLSRKFHSRRSVRAFAVPTRGV